MGRIINTILIISMLISSFSIPAAAAATDTADKSLQYKLLESLSAIDPDFDEQNSITRAEFVDMVVRAAKLESYSENRLSYEDVAESDRYYNSIHIAQNRGLISPAQYFRPNDAITLNETAVVLTSLLGYKIYAMNMGGTMENYLNVASQYGIFSGIGSSNSGGITGRMAVKLVINALESEFIVRTNENEYKTSNISYMNEYLDIYKSSGIITFDGVSECDSKGILADKVRIDEVEYEYSGALEGLIGRNVAFYYRDYEDFGIYELVVCKEKTDNIVYTYDSDSISDKTTTSIFVAENENGRTKSHDIPMNVNFIYNGSAKFGYTAEELKPQVGNVTLISNDGDNKIDLIIVNDYKIAVAATANADQEIISLKAYDQRVTPAVTKLELNSYMNYHIIKNGEKIGINGIQSGDILNIAENAENKSIVISVTNSSVSGEVQGTNLNMDKPYLIIDGAEYELSAGYCDKEAELKLGIRGVFYLDIEGRIVFTDLSTTQRNNYMILLRVGYDEGEDIAFAKLFTRSNTSELLYFCDKVKFKGYDAAACTAVEKIYNHPADLVWAIQNQYSGALYNPVLIETDDRGRIRTLTQPYDNSGLPGYKGYDENNFTLDKSAARQGFMYGWANNCRFSATTPVFVIPKPADELTLSEKRAIMINPENYTATTFETEIGISTTEESRNNAKFYDLDKFNAPELMTCEADYVEETSETTAYNEFMVVTDTYEAVNDDGDIKYKICGYYKGNYGEYFVKDKNVKNVSGVDSPPSFAVSHACLPNNPSERMFGFTTGTKQFTIWGNVGKPVSAIKKGDVIQPNFTMKGEINSFRTLYSSELRGTEVRYRYAGEYNGSPYYLIGQGDETDLVYVSPGEYYELSENPNLDEDAGRAVLYTAYGEIVDVSGSSFRYKTQYRTLEGNELVTHEVERVRTVDRNIYVKDGKVVKQSTADDIQIGDRVFVHVRDYQCNYVYIIRD